MHECYPCVAVDIGNSRIKLGLFAGAAGGSALPLPSATLEAPTRDFNERQLGDWLLQHSAADRAWWIGSVHRPTTGVLLNWLKRFAPDIHVTLLDHAKIPIRSSVEFPEKVGVDRLLGAVAANHLRMNDRAAIVIDLGTALTVDLVTAEGVFGGGAILPGIALSAHALHEFTDQLPLISMEELADPPPACGQNTSAALRSGLYWGAIGAMRELISQLTAQHPLPPNIFLTGGAARVVAELLASDVRHEPHLVLSGIALTALSAQ